MKVVTVKRLIVCFLVISISVLSYKVIKLTDELNELKSKKIDYSSLIEINKRCGERNQELEYLLQKKSK
jgi:hypothetical protein